MNISVINMPLFYGCDNPGVEKGPEVLKNNNLLDIFRENHNVFSLDEVYVQPVSSDSKYSSNNKMKYLDEVVNANNLLAEKVYSACSNNTMSVTIGGDHSLALGTIAGSSKFYGNDMGVIWVDAHTDINTDETSPSGNIHGMPLSASMNIGHKALTEVFYKGQKIKPENVFIIAARDIDAGEEDLIKETPITVWRVTDIKKQGVQNVMNDLLDKLKQKGIKDLHFSFDIDCLDPSYVPGTGTPVEKGINFEEANTIIKGVFDTKLVRSFDFVEFNPRLDENNRTLETCIELLKIISKEIK